MSLADLVRPATRLAREGVPVGHFYRRNAAENLSLLRASEGTAATYLFDGAVPSLGSRIRNLRLADTLERIATEGVEGFYRGDIADDIVGDLQVAGAPIDGCDLETVEGCWKEPMVVRYRDFEVTQTPSVSTGFVLLHQLAMLERFDVDAMRNDPASLIHLMVEIKKLAFICREERGGDPRFVERSIDRLFDTDAISRLVDMIDLKSATDRPLAEAKTASDTTYFCVADAQGQVVSAIQSLNASFGSGVLLPRTGILMNNRMSCWHLGKNHPNRLAPGKKVRQTMNAPMVLRGGKPWAVLGTPGADNQVQVNFQGIIGLADLGLDPQQVAEAPRWSSDQQGQGANWPHTGGNTLTVEDHMPDNVKDELRSKGHKLKVVPPLEGPCSLEIIRILDDGTKVAGSDPRRDGWAASCD